MTDLIQKALKKIINKESTQKKNPEENFGLISRDEILKKVKTISESVKECQKQRLKTFFPAAALKTLLDPHLKNKPKREQSRSSNVFNAKDFEQLKESVANSSINEEPSSFTSSSNSSSSDIDWVAIFPQVSLKFPEVTPEYLEAKQKFEHLEKDFMDKIRLRVEKRATQSILPGSNSIFSLTSCRSYVKYAKEAYEGEEIQFTRAFVSITIEEFVVKPSATVSEWDLKLTLAQIQEIIDKSSSMSIFIIHSNNGLDQATAISPLTKEDYAKWSNTCKNLAKLSEIPYKTQGDLPKKIEESAFLRHRATAFHKVSELSRGIDEEDEADEVSLKTDSQISDLLEEESEKSWDFNFEELDKDLEKAVLSDEQSFSSEDHGQNDEEKIRSMTALAKLGKIEGLVNLLTKGGLFLKYGRWGKPHTRHVLLTGDLKYIEWWHLNENKASGQMIVVNIISVQKGRHTKNFAKFKKPEAESHSFSLICKTRTIDLELAKDNKIPADIWVLAFESLIKQLFKKDQVKRYITKESTKKE